MFPQHKYALAASCARAFIKTVRFMICSRIISCFSELIGDIAEDRHDPADPAEIIRYIRQDDDQIGYFFPRTLCRTDSLGLV